MALKTEPLVRKQYAPYFIVKSAGTCVEYTDDRKLAHAAYDRANGLDKSMYRLDDKGFATCLKRMLGGHELGERAADPA